MKKTKKLWIVSSLASALLFICIVTIWSLITNLYMPSKAQLSSPTEVENYLETVEQALPPNTTYVPTGVFLQSVFFKDSNTVNVTGYIWQKYPLDSLNVITPGIIFPEGINSSYEVKNLVYQETRDDHILYGWFFDTDLYQEFDYKKYPLDHTLIWIRLWRHDFDQNLVLTPDFSSYASTLPGESFGLDEDIVLKGFSIKETFFNFKTLTYDTNFGLDRPMGKSQYPELYFNVAIQRNITTPFVVYLLPIFVIWILLFALLHTFCVEKEKVRIFKISMPAAIATIASLFFVVILSHIQLRTNFFDDDFLYMESFYVITYALMFFMSIDLYLIHMPKGKMPRFIQYEDNLLPKLLYWPFILTMSCIFTVLLL